jgi:hypothetical protein
MSDAGQDREAAEFMGAELERKREGRKPLLLAADPVIVAIERVVPHAPSRRAEGSLADPRLLAITQTDDLRRASTARRDQLRA